MDRYGHPPAYAIGELGANPEGTLERRAVMPRIQSLVNGRTRALPKALLR
jgi:hypothetical protein